MMIINDDDECLNSYEFPKLVNERETTDRQITVLNFIVSLFYSR